MKRSYTDLFPYQSYIDKSEDMTGDGIPDLIATGLDTSGNQPTKIYIIPNNGDGTFAAPTIINSPNQLVFAHNFQIGDVNNDSLKDIVAFFETAPHSVLAYINNGNGTFTQQSLENASQMGYPQYFLDINNDGFGDYIGWYNNAEIRYSLGNGNGTFDPSVNLYNAGNSNFVPYFGDYNGDGLVDFNTRTTIYTNQGNGIFTTGNMPTLSNQEQIRYIRDFNGDGKSDILTQTASVPVHKISLLTRTDTGFNRADYEITNQANWYGTVYIGNFSGNSALDVVINVHTLNKTLVYTNDGTGTLARQDYDKRFGNSYYYNTLVLNDFDQDGKTDVVQSSTANQNGGTHKIFAGASITFQKNVCNRPGEPRIVDFDRSGSTDYSIWKPSTGDWSYRTNDDSLLQTETVNWGLGSLGDIPAPGDYDGDGITDRAVYRNSTGVWYIRRSSDQNWFVLQFGLTDDKPVAADFDGDTITDIAVWRPSDGNWYIWFMGTQQFYAVHWGSDGDKPIPADFDGDLITDVAVYRPSTGVWYYLKSSDGNYAAVQWGIDTDKPIPADFDGDGNADISVYRESENNLYILRSYDFSYAVYKFGIFQDVPQVGDFDGDFVADFAVYRPFAKLWFSSNSQYQTNFGGENVIPTSSVLKIE